jgi:DNA-binding XRE family transcriptional regulator
MTTAQDLAAAMKAWRGRVSQRDAAAILGISKRTLEGIEQGRGFNYPALLLIAMKAIDPNEATNGETS